MEKVLSETLGGRQQIKRKTDRKLCKIYNEINQ